MKPEQTKKVYEFWGKVYEAAAPNISRSTVAIYGYYQKAVCQNGSGVLLKIGDLHFLLSAGHVIDYASIHGIPYMLSSAEGGEPVALHNVRTGTSPLPPNRDPKDPNMRDDDPLDVGFVELNSTARVCRRRLDFLDEFERGAKMAVPGFPGDSEQPALYC